MRKRVRVSNCVRKSERDWMRERKIKREKERVSERECVGKRRECGESCFSLNVTGTVREDTYIPINLHR